VDILRVLGNNTVQKVQHSLRHDPMFSRQDVFTLKQDFEYHSRTSLWITTPGSYSQNLILISKYPQWLGYIPSSLEQMNMLRRVTGKVVILPKLRCLTSTLFLTCRITLKGPLCYEFNYGTRNLQGSYWVS